MRYKINKYFVLGKSVKIRQSTPVSPSAAKCQKLFSFIVAFCLLGLSKRPLIFSDHKRSHSFVHLPVKCSNHQMIKSSIPENKVKSTPDSTEKGRKDSGQGEERRELPCPTEPGRQCCVGLGGG